MEEETENEPSNRLSAHVTPDQAKILASQIPVAEAKIGLTPEKAQATQNQIDTVANNFGKAHDLTDQTIKEAQNDFRTGAAKVEELVGQPKK